MTPRQADETASRFYQGLAEQIAALHHEIRDEPELATLSRVAIALYDPRTDLLKTFIHSTLGESPLDHAAAPLSDLPSLADLGTRGGTRTFNDLEDVARLGREHAIRLVSLGYRSSHTLPIRSAHTLYGFLFFNADRPGVFTSSAIRRLRPYGALISQMVMREMDALRTVQGTVRVLLRISAVRDGETGAHLARMARYARAVAMRLAASHGLTDEFVEYLFQFAPVHDVGKISVPDHILLKPGPLTTAEFEVMKSHVTRGEEIVEMAIGDHSVAPHAHHQMLRHIVAGHHEKIDGSGYPRGLRGTDIPIEARIAAVADVFDALTSQRPYKLAWTNQEAMAVLRAESGTKFDADCVAALLDSADDILDIQARFAETVNG